MITESLGLVAVSAAAAFILAVIAAGTYAFSAEPNALPPALEINSPAMSTINKNQAWPVIAKPTAWHCKERTCQTV